MSEFVPNPKVKKLKKPNKPVLSLKLTYDLKLSSCSTEEPLPRILLQAQSFPGTAVEKDYKYGHNLYCHYPSTTSTLGLQFTCYCETQNISATGLANCLNHESDGVITNEKTLGFGDSDGHFELGLNHSMIGRVRVGGRMAFITAIAKYELYSILKVFWRLRSYI